jgi:aminocarboxymuconate-semialdehyde decarboxylase
MTVIDVHTHALSHDYLELLTKRSGGRYELKTTLVGELAVHREGRACMMVNEEMSDYGKRIRDMDRAGVDLAIVSLANPNVFFGDAAVSRTAARIVNDSMSDQQTLHPDRIRWFASIPWQFEQDAIAELKHAVDRGAVGVFVTAAIDGVALTDRSLAGIWKEIDRLKLPVLIHPGSDARLEDWGLEEYSWVAAVGLGMDTTIALARMILDGFIDRYPNIKLIAGHAGGMLPLIARRLDCAHERIPACSAVIRDKPSSYLRRIFYDAAVQDDTSLELTVSLGTDNNLMFGSDYPCRWGDMKGCLARVGGLPRHMVHKVRGDNARRVFNL